MDLDVLIARALKTRWGMSRPPARAWKRIRHQAGTLMARHARISDWETMARGDHLQFPLLVPFPAAGSLLLWRYDLLVLRFA